MNGALRDRATGAHLDPSSLASLCANQAAMVRRHEKFATFLICYDMTSQFLTRPFINVSFLGVPMGPPPSGELGEACQKREENFGEKISVLHAPSNRFAKGSGEIEAAVANLVAKGCNLELSLLSGLDNKAVVEQIKKSDFVVDQLYSDTPLAGLATEAAWWGKPSVVAGYGLEMKRKFVRADMWPPSSICAPEQIEEAIERMVVDVDYRRNLGRAAQRFVHEQWNRVQVAKRYLKIAQGNFPQNWLVDPSSITYLHGLGQDEQTTARLIGEILDYGGSAALSISRTDLQKALLNFSREIGSI